MEKYRIGYVYSSKTIIDGPNEITIMGPATKSNVIAEKIVEMLNTEEKTEDVKVFDLFDLVPNLSIFELHPNGVIRFWLYGDGINKIDYKYDVEEQMWKKVNEK